MLHSCELFSLTDRGVMGETQFYEWCYMGIAGITSCLVTGKNSDRGRFTHISLLLAPVTETERTGGAKPRDLFTVLYMCILN